MIFHYKCSNCGNDMSFDSESGTLTCPSCENQENIENYPENLITSTFSDDEAKEYHCGNCGATLLTSADTAATKCCFCEAGVVIADRLSGHLAPAKVIPFTISKEEAMKAFKKWCRRGLITPKGFMTADRVKSITGMYVPFWLYDLNSKVQVKGVGTKVRTYESGDYIYTETSYYDVYRDINLNYVKIPVDASEKMNDELMDKLEPFPYEQLKEFKTPYLAGYIAEKYNYTDEELLPRAENKVSEYIESYIQSTVSNYHSVHFNVKNIDTRNVNSKYVLLPVWMIIYDLNQTEHTFAMNGQTGKVVGKPPISYPKVFTWFSGIAAVTLLGLKGLSYMLGGGFW